MGVSTHSTAVVGVVLLADTAQWALSLAGMAVVGTVQRMHRPHLRPCETEADSTHLY